MSYVLSSSDNASYISLCILSVGVDVLVILVLLCSLTDYLKLLIADNII